MPTLIWAKAGLTAPNITPDRVKQVDMIPYFEAGQAFAVLKGNPAGITTELDLCGKKAGAETGTTEIQYLEGTDLGEELARRGPLPMRETIDIMLQALDGLAAAHAMGIIHRDLKPSNLFLVDDRFTDVKLLDCSSRIIPARP